MELPGDSFHFFRLWTLSTQRAPASTHHTALLIDYLRNLRVLLQESCLCGFPTSPARPSGTGFHHRCLLGWPQSRRFRLEPGPGTVFASGGPEREGRQPRYATVRRVRHSVRHSSRG